MEIKITFNIQTAEIKTINKDKLFLQKVLQIIEKNMDQTSFTMEQFSKELGISRVHLHRKLKTLIDQSASEFIRSIRLKRAAYLLQQRTGSVSEIAYISGYNNLSYFTRCFKAQYGVTPSEYSIQTGMAFEVETI
jgi:AraC-like DNA-binding protein